MSGLAAWIALARIRGVGPRLMLRIHNENMKSGQTMDDFVHGGNWQPFLSATQAADLRSMMTRDNAEAELAADDIGFVTLEDKAYPSVLNRLGDGRPPLLYYRGDLSIAESIGVAIVGSRKAGPKALEIARQIATLATSAGLTVVSGYAPGVDAAAHHGALASSGRTTAVLAFGIKEFRWRSELRSLAQPNTYLLLTEYPPAQRWTVGAAMARNKIICALSKAVVVVAARKDGGTIDEARIALEQDRPLFVVEYRSYDESNEGNRMLLERGARPLRQEKGRALPNMTAVFDAINLEGTRQTTMGL